MTAQISENTLLSPDQKSKILGVSCELAPVSDNPGLFWIGWTRPLSNGDFRQLRRFMVCWRAPDLDKNGTPGLDEGWRVTGEGLEQAALLGYQIVIDGGELPAAQGSFRAQVAALLDASKTSGGNHAARQDASLPAPMTRDEVDCSLAPMLVKFLRPEVAIMGADLREYGPFRAVIGGAQDSEFDASVPQCFHQWFRPKPC